MYAQLSLFEETSDLWHEHTFISSKGEVCTIGTDRDFCQWCWICATWVDITGISSWNSYHMSHVELARHYADKVISGKLDRHDAYWLMNKYAPSFGYACTFIDTAIGELKSSM